MSFDEAAKLDGIMTDTNNNVYDPRLGSRGISGLFVPTKTSKLQHH